MVESCTNDGVNVDDAGGGDGKRKVDCEGEADDDGGDNDKADCDDDADGSGGNSKDDGNEDGLFENWCVDGEGGNEADDGDEQIESVAGGLAKYSGSSEEEITVGEITTVSGQKGNIYSFHNNIKVNIACSSMKYNELPHNR